MTRAGTPTAVACAGTGLSTTLPAPIFAPSPISMFPSIVVDAPISTLSPTLGWRSPVSAPVPPKVTWCRMLTLFPTTAVSPITTPVAWSSSIPDPILALGCMSTCSTWLTRLCSASASESLPSATRACASRYDWMAWNPLKLSRHCTYCSHAGSRSFTASMSARHASTMVQSPSRRSQKSSKSAVGSRVLSPSLLLSTKARPRSSLSCDRTVLYRYEASAGSASLSVRASARISDHRS
mmetsp:Transcript_12405/g.43012  ORF Transcript_12405/g.43012 Transcript_12405/m.43012 type:complete len:238 (-) Transcript_12405:113-826(-)